MWIENRIYNMKTNRLLIVGLMFAFVVYSCKVSEKPSIDQEPAEAVAVETDTLIIGQEKDVEVRLYKGERTRHFKLLHTKLEVSFNWEKQYLIGLATLILEPYFYDQSNIVLDAKGFEIHDVSLMSGQNSTKLNYTYDGNTLNIALDKTFGRENKINLNIEYTAKPNEGNYEMEGEDTHKGLYFINPLDDQKNKPQQIWTHGETETNSRWFPTLDAPNQKSTQEIFITVKNKYKTLSNGTLIYSKSNSDGTRTDYWKMDKPHAPYLFMMAIGDFAVIEDDWNGKRIDYYVEHDYAQYAEDIFGNTPEMITYFSEALNYPFPWDKYSQVVVRDFVSGAMENTTASVFMENLNVNSRELVDYNWDDIIAHELFHQWFGDLVTCESWANLPLNESFATYGEFLWKNYKYGKDEGQYHLYSELDAYLTEAENKKENLIRFYYEDDEEMFDSHSYAKGGIILHMLRDYVGDEAFFKSLEFYLKSHAFGKTEIHDLRMAFEHVTGEDLNWFFDQWFLNAGHPKLKIEEKIENGAFIVGISQEQDIDLYPVYKLPLTLDLWENGRKTQFLIEIDKPYQEFEFEDVKNPDLILVDSDFIMVGEKSQTKTSGQYQYQFMNYPDNIRARIEALEFFTENYQDSISKVVLGNALKDSFWVIRQEALFVMEKDSSDLFYVNESVVSSIAMNDPNPLVKAAAIAVLATKKRSDYVEIFKSNLYDSSYSVAGQALYAYLQSNTEEVEHVLDDFQKETNFNITSPIADYYIQNQDVEHYDWFADKINIYSGSDLWYFTKLFGMYLITAPENQVKKGIKELENIAINHYQSYNRLSAYQSLELLSEYAGVTEILNEIKTKEKDPRLREYFND